MDKKGAEDLLLIIGYVVIILAAMGILLFWVNSNSGGKLAQDQVFVKQTSSIISIAKPGTTINVNKELGILGSKVSLGSAEYSFFNKGKISSEKVDGGTLIKIESE